MKRIAAAVLAGGLLLGATGCADQKSEAWLAAKHECVVAGWSVKEDKPEMTFSEIEKHCNSIADKKTK